jgi:hypothetical protein
MLVLAGCGGGKPAGSSKGKPQPEPDQTPKNIATEGGTSVQYALPPAKREKLWDLTWTAGNVALPGPNQTQAQLANVSGSLYLEQKVAGTYRGDVGTADEAKQVLTLRGNVQLTSVQYGAVLTCDEIRYEGDRKLVRAKGHVRVVNKDGRMTNDAELWATADLEKVGTPDIFSKL